MIDVVDSTERKDANLISIVQNSISATNGAVFVGYICVSDLQNT